MAARSVHRAIACQGYRFLSARKKIVNADAFAVTNQFTVSTKDTGATVASCLSKRGHSEGGGSSPREFHGHDLMVNDVVVAGVHAPSVWARTQGLFQRLRRKTVDDDAERPTMLLPVHHIAVEPRSRVGALFRNRAVQAAVGGARRPVYRREMGEPTEARHPGWRLAENVLQPVQVMTSLGHQHGCRLIAASPVATNEGVRLVPEAHRFQVLDADDAAEPSRVNYLLEGVSVRGVPQNVPYGEHDTGLFYRLDDLSAGSLIQRHRFLNHDVVAEGRECRDRLHM